MLRHDWLLTISVKNEYPIISAIIIIIKIEHLFFYSISYDFITNRYDIKVVGEIHAVGRTTYPWQSQK